MSIKQGPLNELNPDIYPIIVAHLPLYIAPSTLLALSLTNRHISSIAVPLLYSRLILRNKADATLMMQKLMDNPSFGRFVRELHIMSNVIDKVEGVILNGYLPFIHTLNLHLITGWYHDDNNYNSVYGFGRLGKQFLIKLKEKCPRVRSIILTGFRDDPEDPWFEDSGVMEVSVSVVIHRADYIC